MIGIGSIGLSKTVTADSAKSIEKKKSAETVKFEFIPGYEEAKERAEQKKENGERWTSNPLFKNKLYSSPGYTVNKDAINKVREKLRSEGIDPDRRTPTHEITDEQIERFAEKYDLEYLSMAGMEDTEYGNFLLDLAYENVFSCDELEFEFFGIQGPDCWVYCWPENGSKGYYMGPNGGLFNTYEDMVKSYRIDYLRSKEPGRTENYYNGKYEDIIAKTQERMNVIYDFFERASKYFHSDLAGLSDIPKPKIEDASEKLKEDFGKIIA